MRPAVAPDDSPFWNYERYVHSEDSGTIYDTWDWSGNSMSSKFGTYSTETLCNDYPNIDNPNFITAVTVIPYIDGDYSSDCSVQSINSQISIVEQNGEQVSGLYSEAYGSCNGVLQGGSFANNNIGELSLNLAGIGASLVNPYLGAFVSSVQDIAQFDFGENTGWLGGGFTCNSDITGYSMQYVPPIPDFNPCDEPISILLSYDPVIGDIGTCTITITTTINLSGYSSWPYCWPGQSSFTFTDTFTHYYGPYSPDPPVSVDCSAPLYPIAETAAVSFPSYYNSLGLGSSLNHVDVALDNDNGVYAGVASGLYDEGLVDSLPTDAEWQSLPNAQLWAIAYNGSLPPQGQNLDPSKILWMLTDGVPTKLAAGQAKGTFISYIRRNADNCLTNNGYTALNLADYQGAQVLNSSLETYNPLPGQTQTIPDGVVNFHDVTYFVSAYLSYFNQGTYNPYVDITAQGIICFNSVKAFVEAYLNYHASHQDVVTQNPGQIGGMEGPDDSSSLIDQGGANDAALSLNAPAVLPTIGSSFNVTLHADNVTDLWAWDTSLNWDPAMLNLTGVAEGPFLATGGSTLFLNSFGDPLVSNGTLQDMGDALMSSSSVSGSGDLATLTFQVLNNSASTSITLSSSELDSPDTGNGYQPIPCTINNLQIQASSGVISAVQQGTTNSDWTVGPTPNPINSTVEVDLGVDNASNIWGWTVPNVTWNPNVLQLTQVTEGSFLTDNAGENPTLLVGNSSSLFDNIDGTITGGLSDSIQGAGISTDSTGVLATLWFNVTASGVANINLSGATLYASSADSVGSPTYANNASVTVNTPLPPIFIDGFESGNFNAWNNTCDETGGLAVVSQNPYDGQYCARAQNVWVYNEDDDTLADYSDSFATNLNQNLTDCFVSFYVNFVDLPSSGNYWIGTTTEAGTGATNVNLYLWNVNGQYELVLHCDSNMYFVLSSPVSISTNTWVHIEYEYKISSVNGAGANGVAALWLNGQQVGNQTGLNNGAVNNTNYVEFGLLNAPMDGNTHSVYFDDVKIGSTYIGS
jgi:hypothetical protein